MMFFTLKYFRRLFWLINDSISKNQRAALCNKSAIHCELFDSEGQSFHGCCEYTESTASFLQKNNVFTFNNVLIFFIFYKSHRKNTLKLE